MRVEDSYGDYVQCVDGVWTAGRSREDITFAVRALYLDVDGWLKALSAEDRDYITLSTDSRLGSGLDFRPVLELWEKRKVASSYSLKQAKPDPRKVSEEAAARAAVLYFETYVRLTRVWELNSPELSLSLYRVLREGAKKHPGEESWRTAPDAVNMYEAAMLRHYLWEFYYPDSNGIDESGEPHDAHALANCVILTDLLKGKEDGV